MPLHLQNIAQHLYLRCKHVGMRGHGLDALAFSGKGVRERRPAMQTIYHQSTRSNTLVGLLCLRCWDTPAFTMIMCVPYVPSTPWTANARILSAYPFAERPDGGARMIVGPQYHSVLGVFALYVDNRHCGLYDADRSLECAKHMRA